jgi:hypothetical protein
MRKARSPTARQLSDFPIRAVSWPRGSIPADWSDRPSAIQADASRLNAEGVRFRNGLADPAARLTYDDLLELLAAHHRRGVHAPA